MNRRFALIALGALFFVTGADGLLVEQTAEKLLSTVVGASTPAGAIVLAVYFGGLALGGFLSTRIRRRFASPLSMYAGVEGVVGGFALVLGVTFPWAQLALARLVALGGDAAGVTFALRLAAAALWLLVPTVAMGASYPAVVDAMPWLGVKRVTVAMARLYALNLFGAVAAAVSGPYLVLPALGMTGTLEAVSGAQLLVVVGALAVGRLGGASSNDAPAPGERHDGLATLRQLLRGLEGRALVAAAFLSGAVAFALEVVWVQLIGAVVGMSVYAFAQMLAVVLLGLWLGSSLVGFVAARRAGPLPTATVPAAFVVAGFAVAVCGMFWDRAPLWFLAASHTVDGFAAGERVRLLAVVRLLLPAATAVGLVYPSLFRSGFFPTDGAARVAGVLGAVNAVGSIIGALTGGFVLIPRLGSEVTYRALAILLIVAGVGFALALRRSRFASSLVASRVLPATAFAGLAGLAAASALPAWDALRLTSGINVYFSVGQVSPADRITFWAEDTAGGITTVVEKKPANPERGGRSLRTLLSNGKFQGNDGGEMAAQIGFALVPCAVTTGRERALVIGLGTGQSAEVIGAAGFRHIEIAELSEGIVAAARARFPHVNGGIVDDPRVRLSIEDGRNHLLRSDRRYDVITMEISSIWFAGAASLYTREFYRLAHAHLAAHGVLQQWVQFHHIAPEELMSAIATMRSVFPHVMLWRLEDQGILIGSNDPIGVLPAAVAELGARPALQRDLHLLDAVFGIHVDDLDRHVLLDEAAVDRVAAAVKQRGIPLNTDANRWLEMTTPRHNLEKIDHTKIALEALSAFTSRR